MPSLNDHIAQQNLEQEIDKILKMPKGRLAVDFAPGCLVEVTFSIEQVVEAATLVLNNNTKVEKRLYSQAGVIVEAGKLGWGSGDVYLTF